MGATGYVGSAILREALERGHEVTALVRHPEKLAPHPRLRAGHADLYDEGSVARAVTGHDAVVSAFSPGHSDPELYQHHLAGARAIVAGVRRARVARLLVVGGAGSLEIAPGVQLVDSPQFPAEWKQTALATREVLALLREEPTLRWTFVSPPMHLDPGERTGTYRVGTDGKVMFDAKGESRISVPDYAVAMIDELDTPKHDRQRFAVAY
jgi:putative NADH-flavin reductase